MTLKVATLYPSTQWIDFTVCFQDLEQFGRRVVALSKELENSDIYNRDCNIGEAWVTIDSFSKRLTILENEAQVRRSPIK